MGAIMWAYWAEIVQTRVSLDVTFYF